MTCLVGAESYAFMQDEAASSWGDAAGSSGTGSSGTEYFFPFVSYGVRCTPLYRQSNAFIGLHQRKHRQAYGANVAGPASFYLHGYYPSGVSASLAQKAIDWCFLDYETDEVASRTVEWAEGPNVTNRRHTGLRVNSASLVGNADSGDLICNVDLIGRQEYAYQTANTLPTDMEKLADFSVTSATLTLFGETTQFSEFTWQLNRNLQPLRLNDWWITQLCGGTRDETLSITIPKTTDKWDQLNRLIADTPGACEGTATIVCQGSHNGTGGSGTYTQMTVVFNRLRFIQNDLAGDKGILMQPLQFEVLKPDTSSNGTTISWANV